MANCCWFEAKVSGYEDKNEKAVINFIQDYLAVEVDDKSDNYIRGYCKWSVFSGIIEGYTSDGKEINILKESKAQKVIIEIYGEESGNDFLEHYTIKDGEIVQEEVIGDARQLIINNLRDNEEDEWADELERYQVNLDADGDDYDPDMEDPISGYSLGELVGSVFNQPFTAGKTPCDFGDFSI